MLNGNGYPMEDSEATVEMSTTERGRARKESQWRTEKSRE